MISSNSGIAIKALIISGFRFARQTGRDCGTIKFDRMKTNTPWGERFLRLCVFMETRLETNSEIDRLVREIRRGGRVISIGGLTSVSAKAFVLAQVQTVTKKDFVIVTQTNDEAETWSSDLAFWKRSETNPQSAGSPPARGGVPRSGGTEGVRGRAGGSDPRSETNPQSAIRNPQSAILLLPSFD